MSGELMWDDTAIELRNLGVGNIRYESANDGSVREFLEIGDTFETLKIDGVCGSAALEDAVEEHGPPQGGAYSSTSAAMTRPCPTTACSLPTIGAASR